MGSMGSESPRKNERKHLSGNITVAALWQDKHARAYNHAIWFRASVRFAGRGSEHGKDSSGERRINGWLWSPERHCALIRGGGVVDSAVAVIGDGGARRGL